MCHEAYEESLDTSGINLKSFFSNPSMAIPIVHASVDFFRPMFCGDRIDIHVMPKYLDDQRFETTYQLVAVGEDRVLAKAITKHVCIDPVSRNKTKLPQEIIQWFQHYGFVEIAALQTIEGQARDTTPTKP
jgi:1,4-dihydroxy-2-naphthoyl-CoA hydrolase